MRKCALNIRKVRLTTQVYGNTTELLLIMVRFMCQLHCLLCSCIGHVQVFDSVHEEILSADTIKQICCIVRSKRSSIKIDIMDVCQQTGTVDCGLFALAYATTLCNGELPQYKNYIQKEMRSHLIKCLQESTPTASPFPSSNRNMQHDVKRTKSVSLHCSCRLPEDPEKRMIQCVICSVWYHEDCEPVVESAWIDENYPWKCRKCAAKAK